MFNLDRFHCTIILFSHFFYCKKLCLFVCLFVCLMVFNTTFNNISAMSVSFIGGGNRRTRKNHWPVASHWRITQCLFLHHPTFYSTLTSEFLKLQHIVDLNVQSYHVRTNSDIISLLSLIMPSNIICLFVCLMVFNPTFNNNSVILWRSVLLVEETRGPR